MPVRKIELQDQFGTTHRVAFPRERISVLALADREGSEQLDGWIRPLAERYRETIDIHGVARLAGVPGVLRPAVRAAFRRSVEHPVMMDWTGDISTSFRYEARRANVVVLAPDGRIVYRFNGEATPEELARCFKGIDLLLDAPGPREG